MALLTKSGRTALADSLRKQTIHLAWGTGDPAWETTHTCTLSFVDDVIQLPHAPVRNVRLSHGSEVYEDCTIDSQKGLILRPESSSTPDSVEIAYTLATAPESLGSVGLLHEVGRRKMDTVAFCCPDEEGSISTPMGHYVQSTEPTNQLYFHCTFDFEDASNETIRELGLFIGTEAADDVPLGKRYLLPEQIKHPGTLLLIEHTVPLIRTVATREAFSYVITL